MGSIKNPELFLCKFQLCPDNGQEKEQDENSGGHRPQNTCGIMAHALQRGGLHRHFPQKAGRVEKRRRNNLAT